MRALARERVVRTCDDDDDDDETMPNSDAQTTAQAGSSSSIEWCGPYVCCRTHTRVYALLCTATQMLYLSHARPVCTHTHTSNGRLGGWQKCAEEADANARARLHARGMYVQSTSGTTRTQANEHNMVQRIFCVRVFPLVSVFFLRFFASFVLRCVFFSVFLCVLFLVCEALTHICFVVSIFMVLLFVLLMVG